MNTPLTPITDMPLIQSGDVRVVDAVACFHRSLDEIAPAGRLHCAMYRNGDEMVFLYRSSGLCLTIHVQPEEMSMSNQEFEEIAYEQEAVTAG